MIEVKVANLAIDRSTNTPIVVLQERDGDRRLHIWIGPAEASAIAMELAGVKFSRPLTHDIVKQIIVGLAAELKQVLITRVEENTYYAELHLHRNGDIVHIDARPSDSIAVALRLSAPIFTDESLLEDSTPDSFDPMPIDPDPVDPDSLKTYLENLDPEDFGKFTT